MNRLPATTAAAGAGALCRRRTAIHPLRRHAPLCRPSHIPGYLRRAKAWRPTCRASAWPRARRVLRRWFMVVGRGSWVLGAGVLPAVSAPVRHAPTTIACSRELRVLGGHAGGARARARPRFGGQNICSTPGLCLPLRLPHPTRQAPMPFSQPLWLGSGAGSCMTVNKVT